jgi:hypothetical protein
MPRFLSRLAGPKMNVASEASLHGHSLSVFQAKQPIHQNAFKWCRKNPTGYSSVGFTVFAKASKQRKLVIRR